MNLRTAHIVLISAAVLLGALLLAWGIWRWSSAGDGTSLATGIGGSAASGVLVLYLRRFLRKR